MGNLEKYRSQIQEWGIAHLYIYGCNVAAGDAGTEFIEKLHQITGANIAASNTVTGNSDLGGNWELEVKIGNIETQPLNLPNYSYTLAPTGTSDNKGILVSGTPTATTIDVLT